VPFFCQDIETVYGYTGPLSTTNTPDFLAAAWDQFCKYCRENHVVTEFIRFHPIIGNHALLDVLDTSSVLGIRDYVWVDLNLSAGELWDQAYSSTNRNMIRKARKLGVQVEYGSTASDFRRFVQLYIANMRRVHAEPYYLFSEAYFAHLKHLVDRSGVLLLACLGDDVVGASILLLGESYAHYHLSASDDRGRRAACTNLLIHHGIGWACDAGAKKMHLGGGMSGGQDDSLFRFKASFSPLRARFHIGKRVHQQETYRWLTSEWERQYPERAPEYCHILQRYRLEFE
jgi:lipid II:glycine glycyltransferase (peptidoglycan interpeptide bridge formation enzyme)